ncbi:MAG: helix-turn-helix domain-containing protein [Eubacteriales bacterium]
MFSTKKFGAYISKIRKKANLTQSELADKLNLTRQAISKYEVGDSFPDISILILISEIYGITLDELIKSGEPTKGEAKILESVAKDTDEQIVFNISDFVNLAPLIKPNMLDRMAQGLNSQGIDISNIVEIVEFLNDSSIIKLLVNATYDTLNDELIEKLLPFLDEKSKSVIIEKIIDGKHDWHMIKTVLPYTEYMTSQIEAAVVDGALPMEVLDMLHDYTYNKLGL